MSTELVIVGAGPAGVAGALWAHTLGLEVRLIEQCPAIGGQLALVHFHPLELPGVAAGTGPEIAATYSAQLRDAGITPECGIAAVTLEGAADGVAVGTTGAGTIAARAVLIASGLRRRRLGVPGEADLAERGVSYSARRDGDRFAGEDVVVVGGGDGAYENALLLTAIGCRVRLVVRGAPRARPEFRARVAADPRITVVEGARVTELVGKEWLESVRIERAGAITTHPARGIVIKIGMSPNTEWCTRLDRDAEGYVKVDAHGRASLNRAWAAGDVARPLLPSIVVALGSAGTALADMRAALRGS